jgi:hypothetical protein
LVEPGCLPGMTESPLGDSMHDVSRLIGALIMMAFFLALIWRYGPGEPREPQGSSNRTAEQEGP